jgi:hypothetical protein
MCLISPFVDGSGKLFAVVRSAQTLFPLHRYTSHRSVGPVARTACLSLGPRSSLWHGSLFWLYIRWAWWILFHDIFFFHCGMQ